MYPLNEQPTHHSRSENVDRISKILHQLVDESDGNPAVARGVDYAIILIEKTVNELRDRHQTLQKFMDN